MTEVPSISLWKGETGSKWHTRPQCNGMNGSYATEERVKIDDLHRRALCTGCANNVRKAGEAWRLSATNSGGLVLLEYQRSDMHTGLNLLKDALKDLPSEAVRTERGTHLVLLAPGRVAEWAAIYSSSVQDTDSLRYRTHGRADERVQKIAARLWQAAQYQEGELRHLQYVMRTVREADWMQDQELAEMSVRIWEDSTINGGALSLEDAVEAAGILLRKEK